MFGDTTQVHGVTGFEINKLMYTLSYQKDTSENARTDTGNLQEFLPVAFHNGLEQSPINIVEDSIEYPNVKDYDRHRQDFSIHFKPDQPGVYRLKFNANTNQIIGVDLDPNNYRDITDKSRLQQTRPLVRPVDRKTIINRLINRSPRHPRQALLPQIPRSMIPRA